MKRRYAYFVVVLFLFMTAKANACVATGQEERLRRLCGRIQSAYAANTLDLANSLRGYVYDECGMSSVVVYERKSPYKLLAHPLRPFLQGKLNFAEIPSYWKENPFIVMAKRLEAQESIYLKEYQTSLGLLQYKRDYWGLRCALGEAETVVLATAQVVSPVEGYVGSNVSAFSYDLTDMPELTSLLEHKGGEGLPSALKEFAKTAYDQSYLKIADALLLPSTLVLEILYSRLEDPEFLTRFLDVYKQFPQNKYALLGFLQSDVEHAVAMASMPPDFDPKQRVEPRSNEAFLNKKTDRKFEIGYPRGIAILVVFVLIVAWLFRRVSNRN